MTWLTSATAPAFTNNSTGWNGFTFRQRIAAAALANGGSKVRVTLAAGPSGDFTLDGAYIGAGASSGDPYDFETTPTQLLFSGAAGVTVVSSATRVSDEVTYALDTSKPLIVSMHFNGLSTLHRTAGAVTNWTAYSKAAVSEAATVNVSGYATAAAGSYCIRTIESYTGPAGRARMWTGSAWVLKPVKAWSGSAWVEKPLKVWNGSAWV